MRKCLILSLLAAFCCAAIISCSKDVHDPDRKEKDAYDLYAENFKVYVGGEVHPSQQWGFGKKFKTRAGSRAADATIKLTDGYEISVSMKFMDDTKGFFPESETPLTDIASWEFHQNKEMASICMIYSCTTANDEVGLYYYDPATEKPEQAKTYVLIDNIQDDLGGYYKYLKFDDRKQDPQPDDGYAVMATGSVQKLLCNQFIIKMDPSYYFGLYVKNTDTQKTYYSNINLNDNKEVYGGLIGVPGDSFAENYERYVFGLSDDDEADCELLFTMEYGYSDENPLVVEQEKKPDPEPELEWLRVIAEDLNAHDMNGDGQIDDTDFDFNDIVIDIAIDTDGNAHCILQAAGATLPIHINNDDNLEVHKLFGVDQDVMVNTNAEKRGLRGAKKDPVEFTIPGPFNEVKDVKIHVYRQGEWMELKAPESRAACKIGVGLDFVWPDERVSLKQLYPKFPDYVKDNINIDDWWKDQPKSR